MKTNKITGLIYSILAIMTIVVTILINWGYIAFAVGFIGLSIAYYPEIKSDIRVFRHFLYWNVKKHFPRKINKSYFQEYKNKEHESNREFKEGTETLFRLRQNMAFLYYRKAFNKFY